MSGMVRNEAVNVVQIGYFLGASCAEHAQSDANTVDARHSYISRRTWSFRHHRRN